MLPVGLCEWKITNIHPILTAMYKNILRTSEAEILKILRTFSQSSKIRPSYKKSTLFFLEEYCFSDSGSIF